MSPRVAAIAVVSIAALVAALALGQSATVSQVTVTSPTTSAIKVETPKVSSVPSTKVSVSDMKTTQPGVTKLSATEVKVTGPTVAKVAFSGSGSAHGAGGGPLSPEEQALVDQASKDDLAWAKPGDDNRQLMNDATKAENDAATKAYAFAMDAGMGRSEAQKLASAARNEVAKGPAPVAPATAPATPAAPAADALPEVTDLSAPGSAAKAEAPSTPPPGT